jgi:hypothetical protein
LGAAPAGAQPLQSRYLGEISCGAWPKTLPVTHTEKALPLNLVLGILFGRASLSGIDTLAMADVYSIGAWMDNYCREHPLVDIIMATYVLEAELRKRAQN